VVPAGICGQLCRKMSGGDGKRRHNLDDVEDDHVSKRARTNPDPQIRVMEMIRAINSVFKSKGEPWRVKKSEVFAPLHVLADALPMEKRDRGMRRLFKTTCRSVHVNEEIQALEALFAPWLPNEMLGQKYSKVTESNWVLVRETLLHTISDEFVLSISIWKFDGGTQNLENKRYQPSDQLGQARLNLQFAESDGCMFRLVAGCDDYPDNAFGNAEDCALPPAQPEVLLPQQVSGNDGQGVQVHAGDSDPSMLPAEEDILLEGHRGQVSGDDGQGDQVHVGDSDPSMPPAEEDISPEGHVSEDDSEGDQVYDDSMPVFKTINALGDHLPFGWVLCDNCKNWRAVRTKYYAKYNKRDANFLCHMQTGMLSERSCRDAPIWAKIFDFFTLEPLKGSSTADREKNSDSDSIARENMAYGRMLRATDVSLSDPDLLSNFVDISHFFLLVRSFGSLDNALSHQDSWEKIVRYQLGLTGGSSKILCQKAASLYESIFKTKPYESADDCLEVFLMKNLSVRHTIVFKQQALLRELGMEEEEIDSFRANVAGNALYCQGLSPEEENWLQGENLPRFVDKSMNVFRSEHVESMLNFFVKSARRLKSVFEHQKKANSLHKTIAAYMAEVISEAEQASQRGDDTERLKLLMVGKPAEGKSFTIDLCLRMSERDLHTYKSEARKTEVPGESVKFEDTDAVVDAEKIIKKPIVFAEAVENAYRPYRIQKIEAEDREIKRFRNKQIFDAEEASRQVYVKYHEKIDTFIKDRDNILPFLLPQNQVSPVYACCTNVSI
jgi:hypothetical protein